MSETWRNVWFWIKLDCGEKYFLEQLLAVHGRVMCAEELMGLNWRIVIQDINVLNNYNNDLFDCVWLTACLLVCLLICWLIYLLIIWFLFLRCVLEQLYYNMQCKCYVLELQICHSLYNILNLLLLAAKCTVDSKYMLFSVFNVLFSMMLCNVNAETNHSQTCVIGMSL